MLTKKKIGIVAICLVLLSSIIAGCIEKETQEPATTPLMPEITPAAKEAKRRL